MDHSLGAREPRVDGQVRQLLGMLEELEQFLARQPRVPLTGKLIVDEEDLYGFLDQFRRAVPLEVRRAVETVLERDRILAAARAEAEQIVRDAQREAERLVAEAAIRRRAEEEAERILEGARRAAQRLREQAEQYADEVLARCQEFVQRALDAVRDGRAQLRPPHRAGAAEAAARGEDGGRGGAGQD